VPCGFYFFNHSSTTIVNGQSFGDWFKDSYIFDAQARQTRSAAHKCEGAAHVPARPLL
jgi:hypothetical protein